MNLNEIFADPSTIKLIATIAAAIILSGVSFVATAYSASKTAVYGRRAWLVVRGQVDTAIMAVDEPGDDVNKAIDSALDRVVPANWDQYSAVFLPALLRSIADGMDEITKVK